MRVAANTATTESMMPSAMERKAGLGTMRMEASEASTVSALNATALPAVSSVSATLAATASRPRRRTRRARRQRGAEPDDEEERVVDAEREGEHEGEVEGPDGHRCTCVVSTSAPAATMSPTMVRSRGRPAATRLPNATIRMAIVTGHESISERSMAERLTLLKSAHNALSPVSVTETPGGDSFARGVLRASAAFTMALGSDAAPAVTTAVRPSRDSDRPGCGSVTVDTSGLACRVRATWLTTRCAAGSEAIGAA